MPKRRRAPKASVKSLQRWKPVTSPPSSPPPPPAVLEVLITCVGTVLPAVLAEIIADYAWIASTHHFTVSSDFDNGSGWTTETYLLHFPTFCSILCENNSLTALRKWLIPDLRTRNPRVRMLDELGEPILDQRLRHPRVRMLNELVDPSEAHVRKNRNSCTFLNNRTMNMIMGMREVGIAFSNRTLACLWPVFYFSHSTEVACDWDEESQMGVILMDPVFSSGLPWWTWFTPVSIHPVWTQIQNVPEVARENTIGIGISAKYEQVIWMYQMDPDRTEFHVMPLPHLVH